MILRSDYIVSWMASTELCHKMFSSYIKVKWLNTMLNVYPDISPLPSQLVHNLVGHMKAEFKKDTGQNIIKNPLETSSKEEVTLFSAWSSANPSSELVLLRC